MLTTLLTASSLLFGQVFPEAPVAPASAAVEATETPTPDTPPIPPTPGGVTAPATAAALQPVEPLPPATEPPAIPAPEPLPPPPPPPSEVLPPPPPPPVEPMVPALPPHKRVEELRPPIDFRVLGTLTFPMWAMEDNQRNFLVGLRSEFDISYFSALFSWDRQGYSPISLSETFVETSYWNGLIGGSVWATKANRIRFLGGVSAINDYYGAKVGPTLGSTVRLGIPIIGVEGAILYTPVGFRQVDGRVEAVLTLFIFEFRAGFRGRWVQVTETSDPPVVSSAGFTISLGLVF